MIKKIFLIQTNLLNVVHFFKKWKEVLFPKFEWTCPFRTKDLCKSETLGRAS